MKIKQLSIFLENKAGRLAHITQILADAGVNLLALSLADTTDFGILRIIADDVDKAKETLKANNMICMVNEVSAVEVEDKPGGLARILGLLQNRNINVEYMYAFSQRQTGQAALILRFDDPEGAIECLTEAGINVFAHVDLL